MKKQRTIGIIISLITLIVSIQAVYAAPAITVEPQSFGVMPGDTITVNIVIDPDGTEIMGAEYKVFFDSTILEAINQDNGTFLSQDGASTNPIANEMNNTVGIIEYGEMRTGVDYGVTDPGILAIIEFEVTGTSGCCELHIDDIILSDPIAAEIPNVTANSARVGVGQPSTSFLISGNIFNEDSSDCNDPVITIINQDLGREWIAKTVDSSNYYSLMLLSCTDIIADETLQFTASNQDESQSKIIDHTVTQNEMDAGGFNLDITFETGVEDTTPPIITATSPDGADIPIDTMITVTFDEAMNQSSTEAAFSINSDLTPSLCINTTVSGTFTWNGNTMSFDPDPDLNEETTYTVTISTQAEDLAGNALENPCTWEFTTVTDVPPPKTTVSIEDVTLDPGESILVPVMINYADNLADCTIEMEYDASVVHVTGIEKGDMDYLVCNINNGTGWMYASALNTTGLSGDIIFAYINFTAVGSKGDESPLNITVVQLLDTGYAPIDHLVIDGTFTIEADNKPPVVTDATVSRDIILGDNARLRTPGTNITTINVTVTDTDSGIASVTIDLSAIGGSAEQAMELIPGTDIWTVTTNAVDGINLTHQLDITAIDDDGNINDSISVTMTVLRRGDVFRDNVVDSKDVMYIARYLAGLEPEFSNPPTMLVADVVGIYGAEEGDGIINRMDVLYIARFVEKFEDEP